MKTRPQAPWYTGQPYTPIADPPEVEVAGGVMRRTTEYTRSWGVVPAPQVRFVVNGQVIGYASSIEGNGDIECEPIETLDIFDVGPSE